MKLQKGPFFALSVTGLISLICLFILTFVQDYSFLNNDVVAQKVKISGIIMYGSFIILCIISFIFPKMYKFYYYGLAFLSYVDIIKGDDLTALMLYILIILMLLCTGWFYKNTIKRILLMFFYWVSLFMLFLILYQFTVTKVIYFAVISFFCAGAFYTVYTLLKPNLTKSISLQVEVSENKVDIDYNQIMFHLDKRQKLLMRELVVNDLKMKEIADKLNISLSTTKKDAAKIYELFGVSNKDELKELVINNGLLGY